MRTKAKETTFDVRPDMVGGQVSTQGSGRQIAPMPEDPSAVAFDGKGYLKEQLRPWRAVRVVALNPDFGLLRGDSTNGYRRTMPESLDEAEALFRRLPSFEVITRAMGTVRKAQQAGPAAEAEILMMATAAVALKTTGKGERHVDVAENIAFVLAEENWAARWPEHVIAAGVYAATFASAFLPDPHEVLAECKAKAETFRSALRIMDWNWEALEELESHLIGHGRLTSAEAEDDWSF